MSDHPLYDPDFPPDRASRLECLIVWLALCTLGWGLIVGTVYLLYLTYCALKG